MHNDPMNTGARPHPADSQTVGDRGPEGEERNETRTGEPTPAGTPAQAEHRGNPDERTAASQRVEIGGPGGLEPTRYGDWERQGRCIDF